LHESREIIIIIIIIEKTSTQKKKKALDDMQPPLYKSEGTQAWGRMVQDAGCDRGEGCRGREDGSMYGGGYPRC